MQFVSALHLPR